jgi:hypothetical protein
MVFNSTRTKPTVEKSHEMKRNIVLMTKIFNSTSIHNLINYHLIFPTRESRQQSPYTDEAKDWTTLKSWLDSCQKSDMHPDQLWDPTNLLLSWYHGCFRLWQSVWSVKLAVNPHPVETVT